MQLAPLFRVTQKFQAQSIADVPAAVREQFAGFKPQGLIQPGQSVAVGVASRGTHDLKDLVITTVACLKGLGLKPFITPAMGSHGGSTGEGQAQVLAGLGISEETTGVPVRASMEVVSLGRVESGAEVFFAQDALAADHIVVINRVKPHTVFRGEVESGLCKILAVGLGRQVGAANMHKYKLGRTIVPAARLIMEKTPMLCGVAVTENALGGTASVRLARPDQFVQTDRSLLQEAWGLLPRIPVEELDILIVEEMGKDISGAGMDPNVIGFWRREGGERRPDYNTLILLDLTAASHGNATGIGMADLTTKAVMEKVDLASTYLNCFTSGVFRSAKLPIPLESDRQALEKALDTVPDPASVRLARIKNTAKLDTLWVTEPVLPELRGRDDLEVDSQPLNLEFDAQGRLAPFPG
jgi:hypothetical protein